MKKQYPKTRESNKDMKLILGDGFEYSMDSAKTRLNNNVVVIGSSGTGKTTNIVIPNIMRADRNYVVVDPKGNIYAKVKDHLESKGYAVMNLNLSNPSGSVGYNFLEYIKSDHDILKLAHILATAESASDKGVNEYFYLASEQVMASAIAMIRWFCDDGLLDTMRLEKVLNFSRGILFPVTEKIWPESDRENSWCDFAERMGSGFTGLPEETAGSILSTIYSLIGKLNTKGVESMMSREDPKIDIKALAKKKTAIFVTVSDTDRSYDALTSIFFLQVMDTLCGIADNECKDQSLPIHTQFIMDDFCTNCRIDSFPKMISSFRSRNISTMIFLQAESQLESYYKKDRATIISSCDTLLYMGGNDLETAKRIGERANVPYRKVLSMPIGSFWLFRRGQEPIYGLNKGLSVDDTAVQGQSVINWGRY